MAHPNEEIARSATEAISKGDMEGFLSLHTDDTVVHFPGRGPLAGDDHTVVLNKTRATRGGKMLEQNQVVVMHIEGGKIAEVWLHFSDQQAMDEFASS